MSDGFPMVALGDVLTQDMEYINQVEPRLYPKISVKLWGKGAVVDTPTDGSSVKMNRHQLAKPGQVIVSEIWAKHGSIGIVPPECAGALVTSHFFLFNIDESQLIPRYMGYLIEGNFLTKIFGATARGSTGYAAIRPRQYLAAQIPLPPLAEQRRIVARVEEVAGKIEAARGLRRGAVEEVEALLASVAAAAFVQDPAIPWFKVKELAEVRGGIQKGPHRTAENNPVRYLTVAHVHRNAISLDDPRYFEVSPAELERWRLQAGDILIIEGNGSADQIGRAALFRGEIENCVHQNHVIRVRPDSSRVDPEYLNHYLNSPLGRDEMQALSRTTSGLRILSIGRIQQITVPVPSRAEQRRIVAHLGALQTKVDALKRLQAETAAELDALLPAVLDRAFSGGL